ncbi:OmpH family outer membrane protein [Mesonia aquimarina]|uniref:OmpH family outer membrane protein n=1 Tax=Mesonia aquimarina TaxID=1504967 RepID=UPI000EF5E8E6|nr:OmpH family outer membrane protein [Mesonia aquimarina]
MKKFALIFIAALAISCNQDKTAYVDNTVLIKEYKNMKATEERFNEKSKEMQKELDAVAKQFQNEVEAFQQQSASMSDEELQKKRTQLMQRQQQLQQQQQAKSQALREESDKVIDSLIDEVKGFVVDYGKEHNYTYIFGSNESANIMYAKEGKDITQDVLKELNGIEETTSKSEKKEE